MCPPLGVRQEIVKTVAPLSGTVAPPPESEAWLKLPSGEVTVQEVTPLVFQNRVVREPRGTDVGTAQMLASGGMTGPLGVVVAVVVVAATTLGVGGWFLVTITCVVGFGTPT